MIPRIQTEGVQLHLETALGSLLAARALLGLS